MKKRTLCLLLAGTMALSLLSGCGGKTADDTPEGPLNSFPAGAENSGGNEEFDPPNPWDGEEEPTSAENEGPFPRDPRWDELKPGESAVQYYDIFVKSGMTLGEVVEAVEGSDIYQEQFITWGPEISDLTSRPYADLDYEVKAQVPESLSIKTSNGKETVTENGLTAKTGLISVKCGDDVIMRVTFFISLPGEDGTVYHARDLPVYHVSPWYDLDDTLTFLGWVGDIKKMSQQDVEDLLDTVFKALDPDTEMVTTRETFDKDNVFMYTFYLRLPLPFSWNGYSLWCCPYEGEPARSIGRYSRLGVNADTNTLYKKYWRHWAIDSMANNNYTLYWAADDAG